ncbi:MAG: T9SS type A sorting domain-containing protein, partial [Bacteroidetes bacterium]|nr:T9SS type A sorting domain-containing protein [Bacteroidota bacterium]
VGGGLNGEVRDMVVFNNKLYAVGAFNIAGGVAANNIAYWDGTNWCGLGSTFNGNINAVEVYNNELYVGGVFNLIDGNPVNYVAKWIGGNFVNQCGNTIGIKENTLSNNQVSVYPNPATNILHISSEQREFENSEIEISNIIGQLILYSAFNSEIDVSKLTQGIYYLKVTTSNKQTYYSKFIKE